MEKVVLARRKDECYSVIQQLALKNRMWQCEVQTQNTVTYTFKTKEKACANLWKHKNVTGAWC